MSYNIHAYSSPPITSFRNSKSNLISFAQWAGDTKWIQTTVYRLRAGCPWSLDDGTNF